MPDRSDELRSLLWNRYNAGFVDTKQAVQEEYLSELQERQRSVQQNPRDPHVYLGLATTHQKLGQHAEALAVLEEGMAQCPATQALYETYIESLKEGNRADQAGSVANQGLMTLNAGASGIMRIAKHLILPVLYDTSEEVDRYRRRFESQLTSFCEETRLDTPAERADALHAVNSRGNFYLAYQGRNDRDLQHQYGRLLRRVMAAGYPQWSRAVAMPPMESAGKLRVGYVSAHFHNHSVMKTHLGWILEHDRTKIDVYTYYVGGKVDATTGEVARNSILSYTPGDLERACEAIARDRLHILVFLDIGMAPITGLMASLRLAPVQCVTWGHPVTSGLETVDYYISSSLMEPANAGEHYSERLVCLPGIGIWYRQPVIPRAILFKTRPQFGLRDDAVVYLSCQSIFKYLPEHDHLFVEIAGRVPTAQFVFLIHNELVAADFRRRLDRAFSNAGLNAGRHCVILPAANQVEYWNLNLLCDVYLDTMEWSGCNTTMEAIACDLPVVTMPGKFMRGRHSYAILTQLGVTETVAHDPAEYVDLAVRLGSDSEWRKSVIARMRAGFSRLYGDKNCVRALEAFYERAVAECPREVGR